MTRSTLGAALLGAALLTGLAACGAGQITQTDVQVAAVPGVNVNSADGQIALRDGMIDYAATYPVGRPIPIEVRLFNNSHKAAQLTGVRVTDDTIHGTVLLVGGPTPTPSPTTPPAKPSTPPSGAPSGSAVASATASPTPSPTPSAIGAAQFSVAIGVGAVAVLTKTGGTYLAITDTSAPLVAGQTVSTELTFTYEDGTTTTMSNVELPVSPPLSPIARPSASE